MWKRGELLLRSNFYSFPHYFIYIFLTSGVKYIFISQMWLFNLLFSSLLSRSVSVSPLEFEITRVDCSFSVSVYLFIHMYVLTALSTSLRKTFFACHFILNENILTDHILSETVCRFCFCVLFSNMCPKIKFMARSWSDISIVK